MNYKKNANNSLAEIPRENLKVIWVNYNPKINKVKLVKTEFSLDNMPIFSENFESITVYDFDTELVFLPEDLDSAKKRLNEIKSKLKL